MSSIIYGSDSSNTATHEMGSEIKLTDSLIKQLIWSKGLFERTDIQWFDKFTRFGNVDPYNALGRTREYIFMTKPDLHLFNNGETSTLNSELKNIPFFQDAILIYKDILKQLQMSHNGNTSPFMNLITNAASSGMDLPGIDANYVDTASTYQGFNMEYRMDSYESDFHPEFSIEFEDTKFLEVYMLLKIYDEYEKIKKDGNVTPPDISYILKKKLHDQWGVYRFVVDEDGESIIHYSKIYGVSFKNVPREAFGNLSDGGGLKFTVNFKGTLIRDMKPEIITSFNQLVGVDNYYEKNPSEDIPIYNSNIESVDNRWVRMPYINTYDVRNWGQESHGINQFPRYKLKWR